MNITVYLPYALGLLLKEFPEINVSRVCQKALRDEIERVTESEAGQDE